MECKLWKKLYKDSNKLLQESKFPPDDFGHISKSFKSNPFHMIYVLISTSSNAQYFFVKDINLDH